MFSFGLSEGRILILTDYDATYYQSNDQDADRTALSWYRRLVFRYSAAGPVLDYGCGTGWLVSHLASQRIADGYEVSDFASSAAKQLNPKSQIFTDMSNVPPAHYAAVTAIHVFEHIAEEEIDSQLAIIKSWLKQNGVLIMVTPDITGMGAVLNGPSWRGFDDPTHINLQSHQWWCRKMRDSGLDVVAQGTDGLWDPPYRSWLGDSLRMVPVAVQVLTGRLFIAPGRGESSVIVARNRNGD
jgi:SAM-dependent methyltransferase